MNVWSFFSVADSCSGKTLWGFKCVCCRTLSYSVPAQSGKRSAALTSQLWFHRVAGLCHGEIRHHWRLQLSCLICPWATTPPWGRTARLSADRVTDKRPSVSVHSGHGEMGRATPSRSQPVCVCVCVRVHQYAYSPTLPELLNTGRNMTGPPSETWTFGSGPQAVRGLHLSLCAVWSYDQSWRESIMSCSGGDVLLL